MEKTHENMFSCFRKKFTHELTKTCMFPCKFPFSAYFTITSLHHNGKGSGIMGRSLILNWPCYRRTDLGCIVLAEMRVKEFVEHCKLLSLV